MFVHIHVHKISTILDPLDEVDFTAVTMCVLANGQVFTLAANIPAINMASGHYAGEKVSVAYGCLLFVYI